MENDLQRLATMLEKFATFLREHGETKWSEWVTGDAERVRSGDYYGVEHFLFAFGGMGSINDLTFPIPGGMGYRPFGKSVTNLVEPAYALAQEIQRRRASLD